MTESFPRPELIMNYSPRLDLRMALVSVEDYAGNASPDYRIEMHCRLRHSSGDFTYSADNLYFDRNSFPRFSSELHKLQQGLAEQAVLKDVGEMVVLKLEGNCRELRATLDIRESIPPSIAALNAALEVDYDLFVNKLSLELDRFVGELRAIPWSAS